jgi:hypothetical protein
MARRTRVAQRSILVVLERSTQTGPCVPPRQIGTDEADDRDAGAPRAGGLG